MLTARNQYGSLITLPEKVTKEFLTEFKMKQTFYCPCCKSEVIIKAGSVKVPHFAHKQNPACYASSEPESAYHLQGKRLLYQWMCQHGFEAELEAYLPEIKQRADVLVQIEGNLYALEFQCSTISESLFKQRTKSYQDMGITPIWILAEVNVKKMKENHFSLTVFQWLFAGNDPEHLRILTFNPIDQRIGALEQLSPFSPRSCFARFTSLPITHANPTFLFSPANKFHFLYVESWRYQRNAWSLSRGRFSKITDPFCHALYVNHLSPALLPPEIGLPVKGMALLETPAVEWQAWFYLDIWQKASINQQITLKQVNHTLLLKIRQGTIRHRHFPLMKQESPLLAVSHYITLLERLGFFKKTEHECFYVKKKLMIPKTHQAYLQQENLLYSRFK